MRGLLCILFIIGCVFATTLNETTQLKLEEAKDVATLYEQYVFDIHNAHLVEDVDLSYFSVELNSTVEGIFISKDTFIGPLPYDPPFKNPRVIDLLATHILEEIGKQMHVRKYGDVPTATQLEYYIQLHKTQSFLDLILQGIDNGSITYTRAMHTHIRAVNLTLSNETGGLLVITSPEFDAYYLDQSNSNESILQNVPYQNTTEYTSVISSKLNETTQQRVGILLDSNEKLVGLVLQNGELANARDIALPQSTIAGSSKDQIEQALTQYEEKNYGKAQDILEQYTLGHPSDASAQRILTSVKEKTNPLGEVAKHSFEVNGYQIPILTIAGVVLVAAAAFVFFKSKNK